MADNVVYSGSCHCETIKFEVLAPRNLKVIDCCCSVCAKKQNLHFIVPASNFKLLAGHTSLTTYTFNTHQAKHMFCSKCGVQSFYIPRSNPDGIGVMPHCLDKPKPVSVTVEKFDGGNWEASIAKHADIKERSKPK